MNVPGNNRMARRAVLNQPDNGVEVATLPANNAHSKSHAYKY